MANEKNFLTLTEAAAYIGTTKNYLYKLAGQQHQIPYYTPTGRKCLFKRAELDEWIEKGRVATDAELMQKATKRVVLGA